MDMDLNSHQALTAAEIEHVKGITNTGKLYYDYDPLIEQARNHAFWICRQYNQSFYQNAQGDIALLQALLGDVGTNPQIEQGFITEFGFNLHIGDNFRAGHDLTMIDCNVVTIGNNVTIGEQVGIYTSNHAMNNQKRANHWCSEQPITIGNNVIIENNVTILPGITIGDNAVITTGAVVTENIPANVIASGVPCRPIN